MDDLILRTAAIEAFDDKRVDRNYGDVSPESVIEVIKSIHAVDAVSVIRCRDCKHRPTDYRDESGDHTGLAIEFPDDCCPCQCEDGWYNWYPNDDWYCANGEA